MNIEYPTWYESTTGPGVSQTIISIVGNIVPILNMLLASKGVNILPEAINGWISLAVFLFFSVRAGIGYVKAKNALTNHIHDLESKVTELGGVLE